MARVLAVDIIEMLQAAVQEYGRELEVHANFSNEGTVGLGDVSRHGRDASLIGIYHDAAPIENAEHEALIDAMIQWRRDTMFGDGLEDDYAAGGLGADRPPHNFSAAEIRHAMGDGWDESFE